MMRSSQRPMSRRLRWALALALSLVLGAAPRHVRADAVDDLHAAGLAAAKRGDWLAAKTSWEQAAALLEHPEPRLEYELGTACAQLDELGPAILHLRVATRLARDAELRRRAQLNLGIVRRRAELAAESTGGRVAPPEPWTETLTEIVASDLVAWSILALAWLGAAAWIASWLLAWREADRAPEGASSAVTRARIQGLAIAVTVAGLLLLPPHVWSRSKVESVLAVVVVGGPTPLLEGPSPRRNTTALLAPGTEGVVDARQAGWVHVVLRDNTAGWAPRSAVAPIEPGALGRTTRSATLPDPKTAAAEAVAGDEEIAATTGATAN